MCKPHVASEVRCCPLAPTPDATPHTIPAVVGGVSGLFPSFSFCFFPHPWRWGRVRQHGAAKRACCLETPRTWGLDAAQRCSTVQQGSTCCTVGRGVAGGRNRGMWCSVGGLVVLLKRSGFVPVRQVLPLWCCTMVFSLHSMQPRGHIVNAALVGACYPWPLRNWTVLPYSMSSVEQLFFPAAVWTSESSSQDAQESRPLLCSWLAGLWLSSVASVLTQLSVVSQTWPRDVTHFMLRLWSPLLLDLSS